MLKIICTLFPVDVLYKPCLSEFSPLKCKSCIAVCSASDGVLSSFGSIDRGPREVIIDPVCPAVLAPGWPVSGGP